ncbi:MAG: ionic transporter y4hA [Pedobacter sp.]
MAGVQGYVFMLKRLKLPMWTIVFPVLSWIAYFSTNFISADPFKIVLAALLISSVLAAVHHAEVIAHRVGEPFGTLILALAITVIEVALIVSLMISGGPETKELARDTVFAAVMIIITGIVGLCLLTGGIKFKEQVFELKGVSATLITLTAIIVLTLILPNYTTSKAGGEYTTSQLIFVSVVSLILYGSFIMIQAVRHRDYFLPKDAGTKGEEHADPPGNLTTTASVILLFVSLGIVVILAKSLSGDIERIVLGLGAPKSLVGVIIASVVLLPEGLAAYRAVKNNRLQTSLNLALGSALASIGLTIPAVAVVSIVTGMDLILGIDTKSTVLLLLSMITVLFTLSGGKTNVLQGIVLLTIFASYLFYTIIP